MPTVFAVGEVHPVFKSLAGPADGMVAAVPGGDPTLIICLDGPRGTDIAYFRDKDLQVGLIPIQPFGYVWLLRVDGVASLEAPFTPHLEQDGPAPLSNRGIREYRLMSFHLVDSLTGRLAALRVATLTPEFSGALETMHQLSLEAEGFRRKLWDADVNAFQARYPTPEHAWPECWARTVAGAQK